MADSLTAAGSYDKAVKAYTSILTIDDKNASAYAKRAGCYEFLGDYEKSLTDYESAVSLAPGNYGYYFGKYDLMVEKGDEAGASEALGQAEKIQPETDADRYNLAVLHFLQGKYDAALSELEESYTAGFSEADYYIGEIYRIRKDYAKAVYYYENYIKSGKINPPGVYNQIAACLIRTGSYEDALEYLEQGIAYNNAGMSRVFLRNEIIAYENLGRFEDAGKKMEEYLIRYPEDAEAQKEAEFITARVNTQDSTQVP
jgi:tetratricopeptide (TPR) repeat protein